MSAAFYKGAAKTLLDKISAFKLEQWQLDFLKQSGFASYDEESGTWTYDAADAVFPPATLSSPKMIVITTALPDGTVEDVEVDMASWPAPWVPPSSWKNALLPAFLPGPTAPWPTAWGTGPGFCPCGCGAVVAEAEAEPPRELELAFTTEPIVGFRAWRVLPLEMHGGIRQPRLASLSDPQLWQPRTRIDAECTARSWRDTIAHEAPWPTCMCGVWALNSERELQEYLTRESGPIAVGKVSLWGRVLEFDRGYRGQHAYPKELHLLGGDAKLARELEELYGVPTDTVRDHRADRSIERDAMVTFAASSQAFSKSMSQLGAQMRKAMVNQVLYGADFASDTVKVKLGTVKLDETVVPDGSDLVYELTPLLPTPAPIPNSSGALLEMQKQILRLLGPTLADFDAQMRRKTPPPRPRPTFRDALRASKNSRPAAAFP